MNDPVSIVVLYPELLGTYGDGGNATVLASRLRWRGMGAEVVEVGVGQVPPAAADLYLLGGGEDGPQTLAARELRRHRVLDRAVARGAAVLAVCAGFQILGNRFTGPDGLPRSGLGLIDCVTRRVSGSRMVGEVVADTHPALNLPVLSGYENHSGATRLGPTARPLATVRIGHGNAGGDGSEGLVDGRVVATYLHGPVLARNPALADLLLSWVVGELAPLEEEDEVAALRSERLEAARTEGRWYRRRR